VSAGARRLPPPRAAAFGWVRGVRLRTPAAAINRPAERLPALVLANFLFSELGGYNNTKRRGTRGAEISLRYLRSNRVTARDIDTDLSAAVLQLIKWAEKAGRGDRRFSRAPFDDAHWGGPTGRTAS
jgi:hypothetical protein